MGQVIFLYRSLAYRNAAAEMLRKARTLRAVPSSARRAAMRWRYAIWSAAKPGLKDASWMRRCRCWR